MWERAAGYTPTAMVAEFQHGLVRLDVVLVALVARSPRASALAAIWMRLGVAGPAARRTNRSALGALAAAAIVACTFVDAELGRLGEPRELVLASRTRRRSSSIREPLRIEVHLAPEDPRRVDLERRALSKLRRVHAEACRCSTSSATSIGLFEQTSAALRRDLVRARRPTRR